MPAERGADSTWTRLRRRKVVQWGLVYVAAAWGFLQGLEYLSGTYDWPRPIQQLTTLALLIGLPVVLVLAWYHGDRGQQRITTPEFAILTLLMLLGGGAFWYYQRASDAETVAETEGSKQSSAAPEAGVLRLAVLPLENLSPDPANAFFADGLHDEILSAMPATQELQVVSRTTMRSYAGTRKPVKQIALELGASHLLAGAVRRAGEHVRLSLHLVDAATDSNIWSHTFDRQLRDALSLQSEVASEIATALDVRLSPGDKRNKDSGLAATGTDTGATNPVAYDLYLKGKLQLDQSFSALDSPPAFDRLEALAARVIEIDPGFARAYTLRARSLLYRLWLLCDLTDEQWRMIGSDIGSARRLAGETVDVVAAQVYFDYYGEMDYPRALANTREALGRYPNDPGLRELEGLLLRRLGQWADSVGAFRTLVDREPSNVSYAGTLIESQVFMRQYPEALSGIHEFERRGPPDVFVASYGAYAREAAKRDPEALRRFLDAWRDRIDPSHAWTVEQDYLRDAGQTEALASHLVTAKAGFLTDSARFGSGLLMPVAGLRGYGRLLNGSTTAPEEAREVSAAAARISRLPSRQWNIALLEAHAALFSGDRPGAEERANRAVELMSEKQDALVGPMVMGSAATVLAWAGQGNEAVQLMRRANGVPNFLPGWAMVRDPLLAVPLAGNSAFEALKREVDPPN